MGSERDAAHAPREGTRYEPREGIPSRIVVVEMVYFQAPGESPLGVGSRYSRKLLTEEQPCERRLKATDSWQELDRAWLEQVSTVVISNQESVKGKILEVAYKDTPPEHTWLILPGESMRASPADVASLMVRSQSGAIRFTANLFPR